jgi:hypothetical protein
MIDAEIVEPLDRESAERLDRRIRLLVGTIHDQIAKLYELVDKAKRGNVHEALGFSSWTAYLADVFTVDVRLKRQQRRELVSYLSGEGMSQRAIADVVGIDQKTVGNDLRREENSSPGPISGLDGKTYKRKPRRELPTVPNGTGKDTPNIPRYEPDESVSVLRGTADATRFLVEVLYKRHPQTLDNPEDIQHAETILDNLDAIKGFIEAARQNTAPGRAPYLDAEKVRQR